jgi:hypothetical protein
MKKILFLAIAASTFAAANGQIAVDPAQNTLVNQRTGKSKTVSAETLRTMKALPVYKAPSPYWMDLDNTVAVVPTNDGRYALSIFIRGNYAKKTLNPKKRTYAMRQQVFLFTEPVTDISRETETRLMFKVGTQMYECRYRELIPADGYKWVLTQYYSAVRM